MGKTKQNNFINGKKIVICIILLFCVSVANVYSQVLKLRATSAAYKSYNEYTERWGAWSDWQSCNILVVVNNNIISIYSQTTQEYDVVKIINNNEIDESGGSSTTFLCVDADGTRCHIRMRVETNENIQLYVEYSDVMFVYNVEKR